MRDGWVISRAMKSCVWSLIALPLGLAIACGDSEEPHGPGGGNAGEPHSEAGTAGNSGTAGTSSAGTSAAGTSTTDAGAANGGSTSTGGAAATGEGGAGAPGEAGSPGSAGAGGDGGEPGAAGQSGAGGEGGGTDAPVSVSQAAPGELVISEVMRNPLAVDDMLGEWFELYNATTHAFDLNGLTVADATASATVGSSLVVEAHGYAVFARSGSAGNGGVDADFVYGNDIQLSNSADLLRLSAGNTILDQVSYDGAGAFPDRAGASMSFFVSAPNAVTNDAAQNWCSAAKRFGTGDLGTPGGPNIGCLLATSELQVGNLVITEIMANPTVADALGEWFEIYNPTTDAFDLQGLTVADADLDSFEIALTLVIAAGDRVVLGPNATLATNGNVPVDYAYSYANFALANAPDEITLSTSAVIDEVAFDGSSAPAGSSLSLSPIASNAIANDTATNYCAATTAAGAGTHATPGAPNEPCAN
jgi:hypothetical protein